MVHCFDVSNSLEARVLIKKLSAGVTGVSGVKAERSVTSRPSSSVARSSPIGGRPSPEKGIRLSTEPPAPASGVRGRRDLGNRRGLRPQIHALPPRNDCRSRLRRVTSKLFPVLIVSQRFKTTQGTHMDHASMGLDPWLALLLYGG